jgi:hypothetical protein
MSVYRLITQTLCTFRYPQKYPFEFWQVFAFPVGRLRWNWHVYDAHE